MAPRAHLLVLVIAVGGCPSPDDQLPPLPPIRYIEPKPAPEPPRTRQPTPKEPKVVFPLRKVAPLLNRAMRSLSWVQAMSRPYVYVCDYRLAYGDSGWKLGKRYKVPLWVLEQLNPGVTLARLRYGRRLRVPARSKFGRKCFTPARLWRNSRDAEPPFYWNPDA